jgi:alkanesulfonate monooxygenase SsuD/methylene tetrahydromethanopterin reductase-like flavin-dependent oxidoreductase (luciferase family)
MRSSQIKILLAVPTRLFAILLVTFLVIQFAPGGPVDQTLTPTFAAKAIATIDHITHGRAGLNIVCGWNQEEFDLHGVEIEQETRYDHGLEWYQV